MALSHVQSLVAGLLVGSTTTYFGRPAVVVRVKGVRTLRMLTHHPVEDVYRLDDGRVYQRIGRMGFGRHKYVQMYESR